MGGVRLAWRLYWGLGHLKQGKRMLIYGAGDAGEMIVRDMTNNGLYDYEPIGFIDDNASKVGRRIHGIPVLGTPQNLPKIMAAKNPHEVLVAIPIPRADAVRMIVKALEPFRVRIKTLPNLREVL